jgi:uncharacterized lipoprotein YehR (DUF1307 family)
MKRSNLYLLLISLLLGVTVSGCGSKDNNSTNHASTSGSSLAGKTTLEVTLNYIKDETQNLKNKNWVGAEISLLNLRDACEQLSSEQKSIRPELLPQLDELVQLINKLDEQIKNRNGADSLLTIEQINDSIKNSFTQTSSAINTTSQ